MVRTSGFHPGNRVSITLGATRPFFVLFLYIRKVERWSCIKKTIIYNGLWCNGNTKAFGAFILGSSPSRPTRNTVN